MEESPLPRQASTGVRQPACGMHPRNLGRGWLGCSLWGRYHQSSSQQELYLPEENKLRTTPEPGHAPPVIPTAGARGIAPPKGRCPVQSYFLTVLSSVAYKILLLQLRTTECVSAYFLQLGGD